MNAKKAANFVLRENANVGWFNGDDGYQHQIVETPCHMLEIRRGNLSGVNVVKARGLVLVDVHEREAPNDILVKTTRYVCPKCNQKVSFGYARDGRVAT